MKKILLVLPTVLLFLTGCLKGGENTQSYSETIGTYIVRQATPMICIDGGLYIHEASMNNYASKNIKEGQRMKVSFTIDLNNQPENLSNKGCYLASGMSISELPLYNVGIKGSDEANYPNVIDGLSSYGLYHQYDRDSYFLTILGYTSGTDLDFKLFYNNTSKLNTNVDTLKFEMCHKKKAGITNQIFYATFDIKDHKAELNTPEKHSVIQIKYKKEGTSQPLFLNIPYLHPKYNN